MVYASIVRPRPTASATVTATAAVKRNAKLKKHSFGRTGWQVTEVCGGTMTWGSFNGKEEMAWEQLDKLYELGVNFIDTAELYPVAFNYGKTTEEWIGNWLRQRVKEGRVDRSSLYFATKCNPIGVGASMPGREGPHGYDVEMLEHSCRGTRAMRLQRARLPPPLTVNSESQRRSRPAGRSLARAPLVRRHRPLPAALAVARHARLWLCGLLPGGLQPADEVRRHGRGVCERALRQGPRRRDGRLRAAGGGSTLDLT
jgi:hypothetical protein